VDQLFQTVDGCRPSEVRRATAFAGLLRLDGSVDLPAELYLWPTTRSYTGQPVAEIHTLGSRPLLDAALREICARGARLAEPGEFTLRAFLAGRLDLTQAEAVLGVIDAADPHQFDVALGQLAGGLASPLHQLRDQLLDLLAHLEAGFDFADEDLPFIEPEELQRQLKSAQVIASRLAEQMASRTEANAVAQVVLIGWPNTGKSSLFNRLAGRRGALVSDHPGTTRDYLTAELSLDGVHCLLTDTAGIEPEPGQLATELWRAAQSATAEQGRVAQLQLVCLDATRPIYPGEQALLDASLPGRLVVWTKVDAAQPQGIPTALGTSSVTGQGIEPLRNRLRDTILASAGGEHHVVASTAVRCRESLRLASESLSRASTIVTTGCAEELVAAEIRVALEELGKVVGAVYTDDILDRIFSRFCIGK
jgi:tRNA modification GTPase